jgi:predicted DNA-binding transcriptional regulator AlpA
MESQDASEMLTTEEFRRKARISKRTVIRWRNAGIGPKPIRIGPRAIRYRAQEVDEFLGLRSTHIAA